MSSSETTLDEFDQNEYGHTFYCCDKGGHPFIAFTTCYCPLCHAISNLARVCEELEEVETQLDNCKESHENLVVNVVKVAPELLI